MALGVISHGIPVDKTNQPLKRDQACDGVIDRRDRELSITDTQVSLAA